MENEQLYNIFDDNNEVEKSNLTMSQVIDYANASFYYEQQDNDEDGIVSFDDAVAILKQHGSDVVSIHHKTQHKNIDVANIDFNSNVTKKANVVNSSEGTQFMELGGNIDEYGIETFFNGLNLKALPTNVGTYIETEILTDEDLELIDINDETFVRVKSLIAEKYPESLKDEVSKPDDGKKEEPIEESEIIKEYMLQISDLKELIEIEDDADLISKYETEISDLNELIEIEKN